MRGHILYVLKTAYPGMASLDVIGLILNDRNFPASHAAIKVQLQYLIDKGYAKAWEKTPEYIESEREIGVTKENFMITTLGIDLYEGVIPPDPGVSLPGVRIG
jgi:hypothetical protein